MSLTYLSGIGAFKRAAKAKGGAAPSTPKAQRLQKVLKKLPTARLIKAVAKQSKVTASKIQKNRAQTQQRRAFKRANEAATIKQNDLDAQEAYNMPELKVNIDNQDVNMEAPDMSNEESDSQDESNGEDMGIIYPEFNGARKIRKAKKQSARQAKKAAKVTNKQGRKNLKAGAKSTKKGARAADTAARGERRGQLLNKGLDTASVLLKKKFGIEETPDNTAQASAAPTASEKSGFLDSIPMPVKLIGGAGLAFLAFKALKK